MAEQYKKGNKFSRYCMIADAAVEWQGLSPEQQELVVVDQGMPFLAGVPDLADRAKALLEAAHDGLIQGQTQTEDGYPLRPTQMRLLRDSVNTWMAKTNMRIATPPPEVAAPQPEPVADPLLTMKDVERKTGLSRSTIIRKIKAGEFPEPTHPGKNSHRWRAQVIYDYINDPKTSNAK